MKEQEKKLKYVKITHEAMSPGGEIYNIMGKCKGSIINNKTIDTIHSLTVYDYIIIPDIGYRIFACSVGQYAAITEDSIEYLLSDKEYKERLKTNNV